MLNAFEDLRIAVLCSRRAPGLDALLRHPHRGSLYDIACVITTEELFAERQRVEAAGVSVLTRPMLRRKLEDRPEYDGATADTLRSLGVNAVVLLWYLYILTEPILAAFPDRIVNVHDSDLTLRRPDGRRRYRGLHSTRDAIIAGEAETRSSVHLVTAGLDSGPVLALSEAYPVAPFAHQAVADGQLDIVRAYAFAHREWMIRNSWGPLLVRTIENFACGRLQAEELVSSQ